MRGYVETTAQAMRLRLRYVMRQKLRRVVSIAVVIIITTILYAHFRLHWKLPAAGRRDSSHHRLAAVALVTQQNALQQAVGGDGKRLHIQNAMMKMALVPRRSKSFVKEDKTEDEHKKVKDEDEVETTTPEPAADYNEDDYEVEDADKEEKGNGREKKSDGKKKKTKKNKDSDEMTDKEYKEMLKEYKEYNAKLKKEGKHDEDGEDYGDEEMTDKEYKEYNAKLKKEGKHDEDEEDYEDEKMTDKEYKEYKELREDYKRSGGKLENLLYKDKKDAKTDEKILLKNNTDRTQRKSEKNRSLRKDSIATDKKNSKVLNAKAPMQVREDDVNLKQEANVEVAEDKRIVGDGQRESAIGALKLDSNNTLRGKPNAVAEVDVSSAAKNAVVCDSECRQFRSSLSSWPSDKPKAVIYYLIHRKALKSLSRSIAALDKHFRKRFQYPIVIFVEPDLDTEADRSYIRGLSQSSGDQMTIYIQVVRFEIPQYVNASAVPKMAGFGKRKRTIGYRHMCRFHAGGVYEQPIMQSDGLEYGWRLDDDSLLTSPVKYDLFKFMKERKLQYGYRKINTGWSPVDNELWDAVDRYVNANALSTPVYNSWPKNAARYFNNFEISAISVWRSKPYQDYFRFVDRLGGIYYKKWGDAAIKTIAVTLFVPKEAVHDFHQVGYIHT